MLNNRQQRRGRDQGIFIAVKSPANTNDPMSQKSVESDHENGPNFYRTDQQLQGNRLLNKRFHPTTEIILSKTLEPTR